MNSLTWMDAKASAPAGTFPADVSDWPALMTADQAASLQRPYAMRDIEGRRRRQALATAIVQAVEVGDLSAQDVAYVVKVETDRSQRAQVAWHEQIRTGRESFDYDFRACGSGGPQRMYALEQRTRKEVEAVAFVAWLQSKGEEPSTHVAAWAKATGAAAAALASAFPLVDWRALVAYRKAHLKGDKGPDWSIGNQIDIGQAELKRRQDAGTTESDALNAMGVDLGLKAGRTVLKRALFAKRKRGKAVQGLQATALPTTTVRSGKKVA